MIEYSIQYRYAKHKPWKRIPTSFHTITEARHRLQMLAKGSGLTDYRIVYRDYVDPPWRPVIE